jgi:NADH-quinone oxidoreductase subunit N
MYFRKPERIETVAPGAGYAWAIGLCSAGTLAIGIAPDIANSLARLGSKLLQ